MNACPSDFLSKESSYGSEPNAFDAFSFYTWSGWAASGGSVPCYVKKELSLYSFPDASNFIGFYSCYPSETTILPTEAQILTASLVSNAALPVTGIMSLFANNFAVGSSNGIVDFFLKPSGGVSCMSQLAPHNIIAALTALINMYGIISVAGFIIPILNALVLLSAMTGISSLIGGETTIIGLSRFL
jgi:hypothetical protein